MKTRRFLLWSVFFGWGLALTSCSEYLADNQDGDGLTIIVNDETDEAQTRAAYAGLHTTFENDDAIGIYAVEGTTVKYSNVKYTYRDGQWLAMGKVPYKDEYTYFAYYPYTANPAAPVFTEDQDENTAFAEMIAGWTIDDDQETLDKFRKNDLMLAKGTHTEGRIVHFTMIHKMALAVIDSDTPTFSYATELDKKERGTMIYHGMVPYYYEDEDEDEGEGKYYLFMRPDQLTTIGGQQLKAGSGNYIEGCGGTLTEKYEMSYSTDGGETFSSECPSWLKGFLEDGEWEEDTPVNFIATVTGEKTTDNKIGEQEIPDTTIPYESEVLRNAKPVSDLDLSVCNNDGTPRESQTTANCYLVHAPGTYKIPLVYGNAIKNGETNTSAYHSTATGSNVKTDLVRHDDSAITDPWIKNNGITVNGAEVVWQDCKGLISAVGVSGDYLTFTISAENIAPGNAVIAAKDGETIVWSWHIWVTDETLSDLVEINTGDLTYQVAPCNVGSVPVYGTGTITETVYAGSSCKVKLTTTNGTEIIFTVTQPPYTEVTATELPVYECSPYYQWGRKDPQIPSNGSGNSNHDTWDGSGNQLTSSSNSTLSSSLGGLLTIGQTIQAPGSYSSGNSTYNEDSFNFWDINRNTASSSGSTTTTPTIKTVYDPCPPGFCIPTDNLFFYMRGNFSSTNAYFDNDKKAMIWQEDNVNLVFPAGGLRSGTNGSLSNNGFNGYYWTASPYRGTTGATNYGYSFSFMSNSSGLSNNNRTTAQSVRAVAEE